MNFLEYFLIGLFLCVTRTQSVDQSEAENVDENTFHLPNNTKPLSYEITLVTSVDKNEFNFTGQVIINLEVLKNSNEIVLNAHELSIESVNLVTQHGTPVELDEWIFDAVKRSLTIPTKQTLIKHTSYTLIINYTGDLRNDEVGFYKSSYINPKGETKQVQSTFGSFSRVNVT